MLANAPSVSISEREWEVLRKKKRQLFSSRREAIRVLRDRYAAFDRKARENGCFSPTTDLVRFYDTHLLADHPLGADSTRDFTSGQYMAVRLGEEPVYRMENFGKLVSGVLGPWFRRTIPGSQIQFMSENANFPWWSEYQFLVEYTPVRGSQWIAFEGMNASYAHEKLPGSDKSAGGFFCGGYNQIYLPITYRDRLNFFPQNIKIFLFDRFRSGGQRVQIPHKIVGGKLRIDREKLEKESPKIFEEFEKVRVKMGVAPW